MKSILSISLGLLMSGLAFGQPVVGGPELTFEKEVHDFGQVDQHGNATTEFRFTNTGSEPLVIARAKQSCGCTIPYWPREPIAPGATNTIKVEYDSKRVGPINKSVTIYSNATNGAEKVLRIKGNIVAASPPTGAPEKKSSMAPVIAN